MFAGLESQAAIDAGATEQALTLAREYLRGPEHTGLLSGALYGEALSLLAAQGHEAAADERERLRWWLLRWSPRHDSGVVYATSDSAEVRAVSIYSVVPMLVLTRDFAPADMQYRMHREHLWDVASGQYRDRFDVEGASALHDTATAQGSGWAAAAIARALHLGGDETPAQMRDRWQRETRTLLDACVDVAEPDAAAKLAYAAYTGVADGWLPDSSLSRADAWAASALDVTTASGRAFVAMAHAARSRR